MTDDPRRRRPRQGGDDSRARKRGASSARSGRSGRPARSSGRPAAKGGKKPAGKARASRPAAKSGSRQGRGAAQKKRTAQPRRLTAEQQRTRRLAAMKEARLRAVRRRRILRIAAWVLLFLILIATFIFVRSKFHEHQQNLIESQGTKKEEVVACTPQMLDIAMEREGSVAGQPINFNISVKNTSDKICYLKAGTEKMVLTVTSGEDHIWASHECREPQPDMRVFRPGVSTTIPITWDGSRTDSSCQDLPAPRPGVYVVTGTINGKTVPALRDAFELTGPNGERPEPEPEDTEESASPEAEDGQGEGGQGEEEAPAEQPEQGGEDTGEPAPDEEAPAESE